MRVSLAEQLAELLERVPQPAVEAFDRRGGLLADHVTRALPGSEGRLGPPGADSLESLFASPPSHGRWMASQLRLRSGRALLRTVVWAYRTHLARALPARAGGLAGGDRAPPGGRRGGRSGRRLRAPD